MESAAAALVMLSVIGVALLAPPCLTTERSGTIACYLDAEAGRQCVVVRTICVGSIAREGSNR